MAHTPHSRLSAPVRMRFVLVHELVYTHIIIIYLYYISPQMGSFIPAVSAQVGVVDRLFARIGASDNVAKHMSTFHMEMTETANILTTATPRSFVILDEIGTQ